MKVMVNLTPKQIKSFWGRVKKGARCWEWIGGKNKLGYGLNTVQQKKIKWTFLAHRLSFFLSSGKDPGKFQVCHSCDNPSCCNPNHLWLGTVHQNMQDKQQKHRAGKNCFRMLYLKYGIQKFQSISWLKSTEFMKLLSEKLEDEIFGSIYKYVQCESIVPTT
jgi:HNH endonuclease